MAVTRTYEPYKALRIGLPTLIIAALGATAMHLSTGTAGVDGGLSLLTTGDTTPTPAATAPVRSGTTKASRATGTVASNVPKSGPAAFAVAPHLATVPVPVPSTLPDVEALNQNLPTAPSGEACDPVNGFIITITDGQPTCVEIHQVAGPYTQAVLDNQLGRELSWSGQGWDCVRNFDSTGITANAHGLICQGKGTFILVSE